MNILKEITEFEKIAEKFGFKWTDAPQILEQVRSECEEIAEVINCSSSTQKLQDEIGDLLHAALSLCLFCGFDPQQTLERNLQKFQRRFTTVVKLAQDAGFTSLENQPFEILMRFWDEAKKLTG